MPVTFSGAALPSSDTAGTVLPSLQWWLVAESWETSRLLPASVSVPLIMSNFSNCGSGPSAALPDWTLVPSLISTG